MPRGRWGSRAGAWAPGGSGPGTRAGRRRASRPWPGSRPRRSCRRCNRPSTPPERLPELLPELLRGALVRRPLDLRQLLQQGTLLGRELGGRPHVHANVQVAAAALTHARQALAAQPIHRGGLRPRLDLERRLAVRRRHADLGAERRLGERERGIDHEIVAVALEARIFGDVEHRDQVARRAVARARHALAAHREVMMIRDARGHVDLDRLLGAHPPVALALGAGLEDHGPVARAARAGRHGEKLPEHRARRAPHLARPAARAARRGLRARRRARAAARGAAFQGPHFDGLGRPGRHLGERQLEADLQVLAAVMLAPGALAAPEQGVEPAQPAEVAHEDVERLGQVEVREPEVRRTPPAPAAPHPARAVAVVQRPLLGITQHLVRFRDLLEALLGGVLLLRPPPDAVRIVLDRQPPVGLLDFGLVGAPRHSQNGVEVLGHSSSSPTRRLVCSTSATILSYGIRVGPITPITPASGPRRYDAVTSVNGASFGSWCSVPMVIVSPRPSRVASASRNRSRRSVTSISPCNRSLVANSGWPASSCALPSTTPPGATPAPAPAPRTSNSSSAS